MRILVAEDDPVTSRLVESTLKRLGWDVITAADGSAAWKTLEELKGDDAPDLIVLDWMMPGMEGIEICRRIRNTPAFELVYIIMLTSRDAKEDLAMGLIAGANDYITKPFHALEIEARVRVGERMVKLQKSLGARIDELEEALTHVRRLQGLLPICSYCKKIRNETNYWQQVDSYLVAHTEVELTHSVCPDCTARLMQELGGDPPSAGPRAENGDLDEGAFLISIGGDRVLAMELVKIFLDELPPRLREIRSAVGEGDAVRLGVSAHALRGSAGAITAGRVASAAASLETIAGSEKFDGAADALSLLEGHVDRLRERLAAMMGRS